MPARRQTHSAGGLGSAGICESAARSGSIRQRTFGPLGHILGSIGSQLYGKKKTARERNESEVGGVGRFLRIVFPLICASVPCAISRAAWAFLRVDDRK
ncbi:hypothetical protein GQ53DRAFT_754421 [Thozetella sp. PMI_491]|nr:hypothetical protein GQ53DRAFT_754421 [Thozetella sp. PMI_491]